MPPLHRKLCFVALVSIVALASQADNALGDPPVGQVNVVNPATNPVLATVTNPATNPVPTAVVNPATMPALTSSVDDPGRIPYQATISTSDCAGLAQCQLHTHTVPVGHRLVIQHVSGSLLATNYTGAPFQVLVTNSASSISFFTQGWVSPGFNYGLTSFDQPVLYYTDSGDYVTIYVDVAGFLGTFANAETMTLSGYLLDCTASPCAPITLQ
jgi:hypothetical protein